jgi:hypothetical protein
MQNWFECKGTYVKIDDDGRERKVTETYLLDAVSYTDAEARFFKNLETMVRGEFSVKKIAASNIIEIFPHEDGQWWFKVRIAIVVIDEEKGKEKKVNNYFLVAADDIQQALDRTKEGLSYILVPYSVTSITLTNIVDVFPYFPDEASQQIPSNLKPVKKDDLPEQEDEDEE